MAEQTLVVTGYTLKITKLEYNYTVKVFDQDGKFIDFAVSATYDDLLAQASAIMTEQDMRRLAEKDLL